MALLKKPEPKAPDLTEEQLDTQIAAGAAAKMLSTPQAIKILQDGFQSPNAVRTVGMFVAQLVERVQDMSEESDIPLNPGVWFMEGGVLDEIGDELSDIAESVGAEFTKSTMDEIKAVVMQIGEQRAAQEEQEGQQEDQGAMPADTQPEVM